LPRAAVTEALRFCHSGGNRAETLGEESQEEKWQVKSRTETPEEENRGESKVETLGEETREETVTLGEETETLEEETQGGRLRPLWGLCRMDMSSSLEITISTHPSRS
jgi:hypothetical protein